MDLNELAQLNMAKCFQDSYVRKQIREVEGGGLQLQRGSAKSNILADSEHSV